MTTEVHPELFLNVKFILPFLILIDVEVKVDLAFKK